MAVAALVAALAPAAAKAHGDLASDALLSSNVSLPDEAKVPPAQQAELVALTKQAAALRIPIRIAVIPGVLDLGPAQPLWREPQRYADFLGGELGGAFHGRVLVVMPAGLGVYHDGRPVNVERSALRGIRVTRNTLGRAAIEATQQLALVAGRRLSPTSGRATMAHSGKDPQNGPGAVLWIAIGAGAAALAALALVTMRLRRR